MCLGIPAKIVEIIEDGNARVEMGGVIKEVQVGLLENPQPGEFVIVHAGFALSLLSEEEALETLALLREVGILAEDGGGHS